MGLDLYHLSLIPNEEKDCWDFIYKDIKNEIPKEMKPSHTKVYHYYDWKKYKEITGLDIVNDYEWYGEIYDEAPHFKFKNKESSEVVNILMKDIPDRTERHKVLYFKEIGYQRKGMLPEFYDDPLVNGDSGLLTTKLQLERLRSHVDPDILDYFDREFTDRFEFGKSVIYPSW